MKGKIVLLAALCGCCLTHIHGFIFLYSELPETIEKLVKDDCLESFAVYVYGEISPGIQA